MTDLRASADAFDPPEAPPRGRVGHSGSIGTTRPRRPHDAGPRGQEKWERYEKARRDPKVRRAIGLFTDVLEQADWYTRPAETGNRRAEYIADYCAELLGVGRLTGPETVEPRIGKLEGGWLAATTCLAQVPWDGFRTLEQIFKLERSRYIQSTRPLVFIEQFADMEPSSIAEWFSDDGVRPYALRQRASWSSAWQPSVSIVPMWKLLYVSYGATGTAWEGRGLLDALVDVVEEKATVRGSTAVAFDRSGHPLPELHFDYKEYAETERAMGGQGSLDTPKAYISKGKDMASDARQGERAYLTANNFMSVRRAWGDVQIDPAERWLGVLNGEIDAVGLGGFLDLTEKGTGRVGDIRRGTQRRRVLGFIRHLATAVREQVFKPCVRYSFGPAAVADTAYLDVDGIGVERLLEALEFLGPLANQKLVDGARIRTPLTNALVGARTGAAEPEPVGPDAEETA